MTSFGNLCGALAALIYVVPVQYLLLELARKRDDGGSGAILGLVVVGALWILLLGGLLATTARGGMDVVPVRRAYLYGLVVASSLALAVVTFVSLVSLNRVGWVERLTIGLPIYVIPPLTIAFIVVALNPGLAPRVPIGVLRMPWMVLAGLSLAGCVSYLGIGIVRRASGAAAQAVHRAQQDPELRANTIARIAAADPQIEFNSLLRDAGDAVSPDVRRLAAERLRLHPDFVGALVEALAQTEPDAAISFVAAADFSDEERRRLAGPLHRAMEGYAEYIHDRLRHYPKDWLRQTRAWGAPAYRAVAVKFAGNGPDFATLPAMFDRAFVPDAP